MITTNKKIVSVNIEQDIESEVNADVQKAIEECIIACSKKYLRNISVGFNVTIK